jgi:hypothetical protein
MSLGKRAGAPAYNARVVESRPVREHIAPSASPEEVAAIVAALERFRRPAPQAGVAAEWPDPWGRAGILEGVAHEDRLCSAWGEPGP